MGEDFVIVMNFVNGVNLDNLIFGKNKQLVSSHYELLSTGCTI